MDANEAVIEEILAERSASRWRSAIEAEMPMVMRWVASLDGEVLFSEGGGYTRSQFVGMRLGEDFGESPEFFSAVSQLLCDTSGGTVVQHAVGKPDNEVSSGLAYVNAYSLLRTSSGRPYAVAVTTIQTTGGTVEDTYFSAVHAGKE
jgi:hypothetical protein